MVNRVVLVSAIILLAFAALFAASFSSYSSGTTSSTATSTATSTASPLLVTVQSSADTPTATSTRAPPTAAAAAERREVDSSTITMTKSSPSPSSAQHRGKFVIISFADSGATAGVLFAAMSRLCWAGMHKYRAVLYTERDFTEFLPKLPNASASSSNKSKPLHPAEFAKQMQWYNLHVTRVRFWSKNFLMRKTLLNRQLVKSSADWVFWFDSDTVITNPAISLELVVARMMRGRLPSQSIAYWKQRRERLEEQEAKQRHENSPMSKTLRKFEAVRNAFAVPSSSNNVNTSSDEPSASPSPSSSRNSSTADNSNSSSNKRAKDYQSENINYPDDRPVLPSMIISDLCGPINNGVFAMRKTQWSFFFLARWRADHASSFLYLDNGPFFHAMLRELARSRGAQYKNECHQKVLIQTVRARIVREWEEKKRANATAPAAVSTRKKKSSDDDEVASQFEGLDDLLAGTTSSSLDTNSNNNFTSNSSSSNDATRALTLADIATKSNIERATAEESDFLDLLQSISSSNTNNKRSNNNNSKFKKSNDGMPNLPSIVPVDDFKRCYEDYLSRVIALGDRHGFVSRCPVSDEPDAEIAYRNFSTSTPTVPPPSSGSKKKQPKQQQRWCFAWLLRDDPHIGGDCRINMGLSPPHWRPSGVWHPVHGLAVHTAGFRNKTQRSQLLTDFAIRFKDRFEPPCF